ncbi:MAG: GFA family protein [Hyphomicrobiaceae bacterium]|nr:MAG: GFA family protein [Hyphomicrobiaceae bacterium]
MTTTRGHCQCGAIAYEFDGAPKWVMHCHCESCRRAVSSVVATYVGVHVAQFRYLKGEPAHYESSPGVKRYFCAVCGSPMAYAGARWPDEVHLFHGTLADPAQWAPTGHAYVGEQVPWFEVSDDLPRYGATAGKGAKPVRHGPRT